MKSIVLATGNKGKVKELEKVFDPFGVELISQNKLNICSAPETGTTFVENAIIKSRHAAHNAKMPALADDSGLVVPALKGKPGIYSARFAGEDANDDENIDKLLHDLKKKDDDERDAYFHCALVFMRSAKDPTPIISQGIWKGRITKKRKGKDGFGYDPVFWVNEMDCTAAQLDKASKNEISHRGKAVIAMINKMRTLGVL